MAGEIRPGQRPTFYTNERLDVVDQEALAQSVPLRVDHLSRSAVFTSRAGGGTSPSGLILSGGSVTVNPTGANDGLIQVNTEALSALDADGRLVVKAAAAGVLQAAVPAGAQQQVYLYWKGTLTGWSKRRFITAISPYTEVEDLVNTVTEDSLDLYFAAGDATNIQVEAPIAAVTRALIFVGLATNTAGVVVFSAAAATNKLTTIPVAPTFPANGFSSGSPLTLHDLALAAHYQIGRDRWKGSRNKPGSNAAAAVANNFHAYSEPPMGLDQVARALPAWITVGDGVTTFGDYDRNAFADDTALLAAVVAALPTNGGTIYLKTSLSNITGDLTLPLSKAVTIQGVADERDPTPRTLLNMQSFAIVGQGGLLTIRHLRLNGHGATIKLQDTQLRCEHVLFTKSDVAGTSALILNGAVSTGFDGVWLDQCIFTAESDTHSASRVAFIDGGTLGVKNLSIRRCMFSMTEHINTMVRLNNVGDNVEIIGCDFNFDTDLGSIATVVPALVWASVGSPSQPPHRLVRDCAFRGSLLGGVPAFSISLHASTGGSDVAGWTTFERCQFLRVSRMTCDPGNAVTATMEHLTFRDCRFDPCILHVILRLASVLRDIRFERCVFNVTTLRLYGTGSISRLAFIECEFIDGFTDLFNTASNVKISSSGDVTDVRFEGCVIRDQDISGGALLTIDGSTVQDLRVAGCTFTRLTYSSGAFTTVGFVSVSPTSLVNCAFVGNTAADCFNGTTFNGTWRWFQVSLVTTSISGLTVSKNQASNMGDTQAVAAGQLVHGTYVYITGQAGCVVNGMLISDNVFGSANSRAQILSLRLVTVEACVVKDNVCAWQYGPAETYMHLAHLFFELLGSSKSLIVQNNTFTIANNTGATISQHLWRLRIDAVGASLRTLRIENNTIDIGAAGAQGYAAATGFSITTAVVTNLVLNFNTIAAIDQVYTAGFLGFTTSIPAAIPAAGSVWSNNINLKNS